MTRSTKYLFVSILIIFTLACNAITQPFRDAQEAVGTVQSVASALPIETIQAAITAMPVETLQSLPSAVPDLTNMFDPQGEPAEEYKGVPIMSQATAGQEFAESNTYSFKADASIKDVENFYNDEMVKAGWSSFFPATGDETSTILVFQKGSTVATITATDIDGVLIVLITVV